MNKLADNRYDLAKPWCKKLSSVDMNLDIMNDKLNLGLKCSNNLSNNNINYNNNSNVNHNKFVITNQLKCLYSNFRSIMSCGKREELNSLIIEHNIAIVAVTESWTHEGISDAEINLNGFNMFRKDRDIKGFNGGGGLILYIKDHLAATQIVDVLDIGCESMWISLKLDIDLLTIGICYRRPNALKDEFKNLCNQIKKYSAQHCLIMGDFNYGDIDWGSQLAGGGEATEFSDLTNDAFLVQHVLTPTRESNILDLIFSSDNDMEENLEVIAQISTRDHNALLFSLNAGNISHSAIHSAVKFDYHKGNYPEINCHLKSIDWVGLFSPVNTLEKWCMLKNNVTELKEKYIPICKPSNKNNNPPWMKFKVIKEIKARNRLWKTYNDDPGYSRLSRYNKARNKSIANIRKAKCNFENQLSDKIKVDPKSFYAYLRSRSSIGPLKNDKGKLIDSALEMSELLNKHFASVFTVENLHQIPEAIRYFA